ADVLRSALGSGRPSGRRKWATGAIESPASDIRRSRSALSTCSIDCPTTGSGMLPLDFNRDSVRVTLMNTTSKKKVANSCRERRSALDPNKLVFTNLWSHQKGK